MADFEIERGPSSDSEGCPVRRRASRWKGSSPWSRPICPLETRDFVYTGEDGNPAYSCSKLDSLILDQTTLARFVRRAGGCSYTRLRELRVTGKYIDRGGNTVACVNTDTSIRNRLLARFLLYTVDPVVLLSSA